MRDNNSLEIQTHEKGMCFFYFLSNTIFWLNIFLVICGFLHIYIYEHMYEHIIFFFFPNLINYFPDWHKDPEVVQLLLYSIFMLN